MTKKFALLCCCVVATAPLFAQTGGNSQQKPGDIYRGTVFGENNGDIYRGTTFGAQQKNYHSDTLGDRAPATTKYVYDTSLMRAVKIDDADRIRTLIYANVDTNERNYAGIAPLAVAAERGNVEILRLMVEQGKADVNITSSYGITPLIAASAAGKTDAVKYLLAHGADATAKDNTGKTPILYAMQNDAPELVAALAKANPISVNLPDPNGNTPLILAAQRGFLKQTKNLLAGGANPDYRNPSSGLSALAAAAAEGHIDVIRALVRNGQATIDLPDLNGRTPLMYAAEQGQPAALHTLLQLKADVNAQDNTGATALMRATAKDNEEIMTILLKDKSSKLFQKDFQGRDAFIYSAFAPTPQAATLLLQHGADLETRDLKNNTPLLTAIQAKNDRMALFFIQQGADLTATNTQGQTAFTLAPVYLPDSMTEKVLQVKQQEIQQQALQEQAAQLARVRELEQQLAEQEARAQELLEQQNRELEQQRLAEQERLKEVYEQEVESDPDVLALQEQLEALKAKKVSQKQQAALQELN